jgi:hypothetical protein
VNHRLESRMRENRLSGSEGGGTKPIASPYPYRKCYSNWASAFMRIVITSERFH